MRSPAPVPADIQLSSLMASENARHSRTHAVCFACCPGMNFDNKTNLYEAAKASLKKLKGDERRMSEHLAIKFEQSYLAENEEALLTAGYVRTRPSNQGYNRGRAL